MASYFWRWAVVNAASGTSGPARQAVKYSFLDRFIATMVTLKNKNVATIVCGDYNIAHRDIDVFDPKSWSYWHAVFGLPERPLPGGSLK